MTAMALVEKPEAVKRHLAHAGRPPVPRHRRTWLRRDDALVLPHLAPMAGRRPPLPKRSPAATILTHDPPEAPWTPPHSAQLEQLPNAALRLALPNGISAHHIQTICCVRQRRATLHPCESCRWCGPRCASGSPQTRPRATVAVMPLEAGESVPPEHRTAAEAGVVQGVSATMRDRVMPPKEVAALGCALPVCVARAVEVRFVIHMGVGSDNVLRADLYDARLMAVRSSDEEPLGVDAAQVTQAGYTLGARLAAAVQSVLGQEGGTQPAATPQPAPEAAPATPAPSRPRASPTLTIPPTATMLPLRGNGSRRGHVRRLRVPVLYRLHCLRRVRGAAGIHGVFHTGYREHPQRRWRPGVVPAPLHAARPGRVGLQPDGGDVGDASGVPVAPGCPWFSPATAASPAGAAPAAASIPAPWMPVGFDRLEE